MSLFPVLRKRKQAGFWELGASLVYLANSRPGRKKKDGMPGLVAHL